MKTKNYFLTLWSKSALDNAMSMDFTYILHGEEICPTTNRQHWHVFIQFRTRKTHSGVCKLFKGHDVQVAKGSPEDTKLYLEKATNLYESGEFIKQGQRNDLKKAREAALDPSRGMAYVCMNFNYQAIKVSEKVQQYCGSKRSSRPYCKWIWGETGIGKSTLAHKEAGDIFYPKSNNKWWDLSFGIDNVIWDDFVLPDEVKLQDILNWLDPWYCLGQVKGGTNSICFKRIWFTANYHPERYGKEFSRRFDEIIHLKNGHK